MKLNQKLKIALLILIIVFISLISFIGIFVQDKGIMKNLLPEYALGRDLKGGRGVTLEVHNHDHDHNHEHEHEEENKEEKKSEEEKAEEHEHKEPTKDDFKVAKNIIDNRLDSMGAQDFLLSLDENTGLINVQIEEGVRTDELIQYMSLPGEFIVEDEEGKVLLNTSNLKRVRTMYGQVSNETEEGYKVYLKIELDQDGAEKLKEISKTYIKSTDEEGKDTSKKVLIKLDSLTLAEVSYEKEVTDGVIELAVGSTTKSSTQLQAYLEQASYLEVVMNSGVIPVEYEITRNNYIMSDITQNTIIVAIALISVAIIAILIYFIFKYHKNGILVAISSIGYIALLLIAIRYTNVVITIEGMAGIVIAIILNFVLTNYILKNLENTKGEKAELAGKFNKGFLKGLIVLVPNIIIAVALCFMGWVSIASLGMVMFWGIIITVIYNILITKSLIINFTK